MAKFRGKYRIKSARAAWWNYRNDGAYFITICTYGKRHFFGECIEGQMRLSPAGAMVQGFWYEIPKHFPHVKLGVFQVMPNHLHGILILDKSGTTDDRAVGDGTDVGDVTHVVETLQCNVSTSQPPQPPQSPPSDLSQQSPSDPPQPPSSDPPVETPHDYFSRISPKPGSVAAIVRSYKSVCTRNIRQVLPELEFDWQERYWDNIIRDESAFFRITHYIIHNPENWEDDMFFSAE
jgi:putative transposase